MGNNKYQLYVVAVLASGLFCADQFCRPWFVNVALQMSEDAPLQEGGKMPNQKIAIEIPRTTFGERKEEKLREARIDRQLDEDCWYPEGEASCGSREEISALELDMAEVDTSGQIKMNPVNVGGKGRRNSP